MLTGYVDRIAINQAIADARRDSIDPDITDAYLRQANALCGHFETRLTRWSLPDGPRQEGRGRPPTRACWRIVRNYRREIARRPAPAKWRALKAAVAEASMDTRRDRVRRPPSSPSTAIIAAHRRRRSASTRSRHQLDRRFNEAGLTDCAINRRS